MWYRMFYGPGGPYALFAGKDASRALAKMSFEEADLTGNIEGLNTMELDALQDWEWKFQTKYVKVGQIKSEKSSKSTEAASDQGVTVKDEESNESISSEVLSGQVRENGNEKENGQESGLAESVKDEETEDSTGIKSREVPLIDDSAAPNGDAKVKQEEVIEGA